MKKLLFLLTTLTVSMTVCAQSAEERMNTQLQKGDYLAVARLLPEVCDSLSQRTRLIAEALSNARLRRYEASDAAIKTLISGETGEIVDPQLQGLLISELMSNYRLSGDNAGAANLIKLLQDRDPENSEYPDIYQYFNTLAALPPVRLSRPEEDVVIPFRLDSVGRGSAMVVEVGIGGKSEPFIFDTGCAEMSFASNAFAQSHGIRPTGAEIEIGGIAGSGKGWLGIADSLTVGRMTLHNVLFAVAPSLPTDSLLNISAILGCNFMLAAQQIQFRGPEHKIIFPAEKSPAPSFAPNMVIGTNGLFYVQIEADGETLTMQFDSGNVKSTLTSNYFRNHRAQIESTYIRDTLITGGFGGIVNGNSYRKPQVTLRFGDSSGVLSNVKITEDLDLHHETGEDGSLGVDFLLAFDCVIVDYQQMFISAQPTTAPTSALKATPLPDSVSVNRPKQKRSAAKDGFGTIGENLQSSVKGSKTE